MRAVIIGSLFLIGCGNAVASVRSSSQARHETADIQAPYTFAVIGDVPYTTREQNARGEWSKFHRLISDLAQRHLAFVVHVGDIADGGTACPTAHIANVKAEFDRLNVPWIYTPGDNEWIDCVTDGQTHPGDQRPIDVVDKLADLRRTFFNGWSSLQRVHALPGWSTQGDPIENQMWRAPGVTFATVHLVTWGDAFHRAHGNDPQYRGEFVHRALQARRWVEAATAAAENAGNKLIIIFSQAGVAGCRNESQQCQHGRNDDNETPGIGARLEGGGFFDDWNEAAKGNFYLNHNFLYVHGDYHCFHGPQTLFLHDRAAAPNLYSLQVNGSPEVEALLITVRPGIERPEQLDIRRLQCSDANGRCNIVTQPTNCR